MAMLRCLASGKKVQGNNSLSGKIFLGITTKGALFLSDFSDVSVRMFWVVFLQYLLYNEKW